MDIQLTPPKLGDAVKVLSPSYIDVAFEGNEDFANILLYVYTGMYDNLPDVEEVQPTFSIDVDKRETYINNRVNISNLLKTFIYPEFSGNTFSNFFCFFVYDIQYYQDGAFKRRKGFSNVNIACKGYVFNSSSSSSNKMGDDSPYLADGTINHRFAIGAYENHEYKVALKDSPYNFYTVTGSTEIRESDTNNDLYEVSNSGFLDIHCDKNGYQVLFLDKNGLIDWLTLTGKVTESIEYERGVYHTNNTISTFDSAMPNNGYKTYIINTGKLHPVLTNKVEELLLSSYVLLYQKAENRLIPVMVTDSDFRLRSKRNDKSNINYNIKFKERHKIVK